MHETLTVTAGVAASAGRGETPRSEVGANIVRANANALASSSPKTTVPIGGAVLLVTGYPPLCSGAEEERCEDPRPVPL